ncbi:CRISPR-associated helicase Cas3' [Marinobacter halodurans]|uniref:CRISPR-associated helicase Cas3' n=1 Tax=Marinobacter halodurans TaxID=2528979 RepID=UPI001A9544C8|nr:CRISPR-associated helicase Cas3' [Marinobacter halodurans]
MYEHLQEVGDLAEEFARKIGLEGAGRLIGLLHDFGKYSSQFQNYIKSATGDYDRDDDDYVDAVSLKGKIDHSSAGAQWLWKKMRVFGGAGQGELCGQILALCIASHHSGLIDCVDRNDRLVFSERMAKPEAKTHVSECDASADKELIEQIKALADVGLVKELFGKLQNLADFDRGRREGFTIAEHFRIGFLTRFLLSCLIDADRLNSAEFEMPERVVEREARVGNQSWPIAIGRLEEKLALLSARNHVDELRSEISENCRSRAAGKQGIYTLTVPTGGGKTYASLRYALHHAQNHGLDRIIYIIPYTSIIEQNAQAIRDLIERDSDDFPWVLEHHSNLEPEQQTWQSKLVSENWDAPIVLTTMVQFLETLFSGGTRSVRRLHQLANTVLVFDEIQTLPVNCVHLFCNAVNFLVDHCRTTAVLCTATQPLLNQLRNPDQGQLVIPDDNELAGNVAESFEALSRVNIDNACKPGGWSLNEVSELIMEQYQIVGSCLLIVNTKAWAKSVYEACKEHVGSEALFHLSTNQCPAHRKQMFGVIRSRLDEGLPVLCVSTQLIEAGVDIDFACVIRFVAGLDSIAQAAGRCNRNGRLKDDAGNLRKGHVYVVNPDHETTGMLEDIQVGKEMAHRVLSEAHDDFLAPAAMNRYFEYYFFNRAGEMAYPLTAKQVGRETSILNLLSANCGCNAEYPGRAGRIPLMKHSFQEAARQFKAIDAPTEGVIVPYGEGIALINDLCGIGKEFDPGTYYRRLRDAQQFSVNLFPNVFTKLREVGALHEIQEGYGIYYLKEEHYSEAFGVSAEVVASHSFLSV